MQIYIVECWRETGEIRFPLRGEYYLNDYDGPTLAQSDHQYEEIILEKTFTRVAGEELE